MKKSLFPPKREFYMGNARYWKKIHKLNAEIRGISLQLKEIAEKQYFINKELERIK